MLFGPPDEAAGAAAAGLAASVGFAAAGALVAAPAAAGAAGAEVAAGGAAAGLFSGWADGVQASRAAAPSTTALAPRNDRRLSCRLVGSLIVVVLPAIRVGARPG